MYMYVHVCTHARAHTHTRIRHTQQAVSKLINPAIGDALSDLLAVVAVLISGIH